MKELFNDILNIEGVKGLMMLSFAGDVIFTEFPVMHKDVGNIDWRLFIESLAGTRETDLSKETAISEIGAVCLACGCRPETLKEPLVGHCFRPVEWEWQSANSQPQSALAANLLRPSYHANPRHSAGNL